MSAEKEAHLFPGHCRSMPALASHFKEETNMAPTHPFDENRSGEVPEQPRQPRLWTRRRLIQAGGASIIGGIAISPLLASGFQALAASAASGPLPWAAANAILSQTTVPTFPSRTFSVT